MRSGFFIKKLSEVLPKETIIFDEALTNSPPIGRYIPGKKILIKNSNYLNQLKKSYIIILAWNFSESIIQKCKSNEIGSL